MMIIFLISYNILNLQSFRRQYNFNKNLLEFVLRNYLALTGV